MVARVFRRRENPSPKYIPFLKKHIFASLIYLFLSKKYINRKKRYIFQEEEYMDYRKKYLSLPVPQLISQRRHRSVFGNAVNGVARVGVVGAF